MVYVQYSPESCSEVGTMMGRILKSFARFFGNIFEYVERSNVLLDGEMKC